MYKLILFLKRVTVPVLFIVMEVLAIGYYARSTSFSRARLLTASNMVVGGINGWFRNVGDYFALRRENETLLQRVDDLENKLAQYGTAEVESPATNGELSPYTYTCAEVIDNSVYRQNNFFTINKGLRDGVEGNMAVLTPEGFVAGYVIDCSEKFSVCMSVANRSFTMGGKTKNKDYMGSVVWNGRDYRHVNLTDIPYYADFAQGDTVLSTVSYRFPPDRIIGIVERFKVSDDRMNCEVTVRLAADLSELRKVLLVKYIDSAELEQLQTKYK